MTPAAKYCLPLVMAADPCLLSLLLLLLPPLHFVAIEL